jgi:glycerol dehydrogenase-like iron-containing ADH family enzyme
MAARMMPTIPTGVAEVAPGCLAARLHDAGPDHLVVHSPSSRPPGLSLGRAARVCVRGLASLDAVERAEAEVAWPDIGTIVALGAGSVIDTAKLLAARHGMRLLAAPTVLSCNAFATSKSVVTVQGARRSIDSREPDLVLIDPVVLARAPLRLHLMGLADALSIHTALHDWRLATEAGLEPHDALTFGLAESVGHYCFDAVDVIDAADSAEAVYTEIARILAVSGYLTRFYGSGRPESGSEHMFARATELEPRETGHLWHGEAVLLGTLLLSHLQGQRLPALFETAARLGLQRTIADRGLTPARVASLLCTAGRIRRDRYTIFNSIGLSAHEALDCAHDVLGTLGAVSAPVLSLDRLRLAASR